MIKLFNKIRKQLLDQNKTRRYLKYAIGEIVLVMIGILLALQVNTWNQNRILQKEEFKILKSLHQEFSENLKRFDEIYKKQEYRKKCIETLMSVNVNELSIDSLNALSGGVGQQWTFDPFQGNYNSVINSGKIELISSDLLKKELSEFQDLLNDYKEEEIFLNEFTANNYYPFIIDHIKLEFNFVFAVKHPTEKEKELLKSRFIKLREADKYENLLIYIYGHMTDIFTEGPILREEMESIISLLDSEIEKYN